MVGFSQLLTAATTELHKPKTSMGADGIYVNKTNLNTNTLNNTKPQKSHRNN